MFARLTHVASTPEKLNQVIALFQDAVTPLLKQQPGFHSSLLLTDPATGKGMSITLWDTDAAMRAGDSNAALMEQIIKVMPLLTAPPVAEIYHASQPG